MLIELLFHTRKKTCRSQRLFHEAARQHLQFGRHAHFAFVYMQLRYVCLAVQISDCGRHWESVSRTSLRGRRKMLVMHLQDAASYLR